MLLQTSLCSILEVYFLDNSYNTVHGLLLNEVNDDNSNHQSYNTSSPIKVDFRGKNYCVLLFVTLLLFFFNFHMALLVFWFCKIVRMSNQSP